MLRVPFPKPLLVLFLLPLLPVSNLPVVPNFPSLLLYFVDVENMFLTGVALFTL